MSDVGGPPTMITQRCHQQKHRRGTTLVEIGDRAASFPGLRAGDHRIWPCPVSHTTCSTTPAVRQRGWVLSKEPPRPMSWPVSTKPWHPSLIPATSPFLSTMPASTIPGSAPPTSGAGIEALPSVELSNAEPRQMFVIRAALELQRHRYRANAFPERCRTQ